MREEEFVKAVEGAGGTVYLVGGWVRDHLKGAKPRDKDFVITGLEREVFAKLFPAASLIGHAFPVYLVEIDGVRSEVSFARRERKSGHGYRGFAVDFGAEVTIEDDLFRRDTRINSMAYRLPAMELIDPYGGRGDLAHRLIRATSHHFSEDPVRALRAARQAAELGFVIEDGTRTLMADCATELEEEPTERIVHELSRALAAPQPSLFFEALAHASLLESVFPEIFALKGKTQPPEYHPEGDAYCHTMQIVDVVARKTQTIEARHRQREDSRGNAAASLRARAARTPCTRCVEQAHDLAKIVAYGGVLRHQGAHACTAFEKDGKDCRSFACGRKIGAFLRRFSSYHLRRPWHFAVLSGAWGRAVAENASSARYGGTARTSRRGRGEMAA